MYRISDEANIQYILMQNIIKSFSTYGNDNKVKNYMIFILSNHTKEYIVITHEYCLA